MNFQLSTLRPAVRAIFADTACGKPLRRAMSCCLCKIAGFPASLAVLFAATVPCHAQVVDFTVFVNNVNPTTLDANAVNYAQGGGIASTSAGGTYRSLFIPDTLPAGAGHALVTPSIIRFAQVQTTGLPNPATNSFSTFDTSKAAFDFALQNGSHPGGMDANLPFTQILVEGQVTGNVGVSSTGTPFSGAVFLVQSVKNVTNPTNVAILTASPLTSVASFLVQAQVGGVTYNVYVNQVIPIPPLGTQPTTVYGYMTANSYNVSGTVHLMDSVAAVARPVTFTFRDVTGSTQLFTYNAQMSPNGNYTLTSVPPGQYNVLVKTANYLAKTILVDTSRGNVAGANVTLPGGDINNDGLVDIADFAILVSNYQANDAP